MTLTRRTLCQAAVAAAAAALTGCGAQLYRGPDRDITIAGGLRGGFYLEVAQLLAHEVNAAEPGLHCTAVSTNGSKDNLEQIESGEAEIAVCQSDVALAAVTGTDPYRDVQSVAGIGRMYEDYLQLVVRADSGIESITDLAGARVSLGAKGSGTAMTGERLMAAATVAVRERNDTLEVAVDKVAAGEVEALLWSGGVPTPPIAELHREVGIRLLPLAKALPALRNTYDGAYQSVTIPATGYGHSGVDTIGVANLLVCGRSLPTDIAAAITAVVVGQAGRLVPPQAVGTQFLDRRALINLLGVPMHPGAVSAYRQLHG
ncbi:TAXI family TRAP transporter solute-binding subunit [Actinophytocola oryzae]|uniref:TRAP transporter TAXI family solute receptor n=1 Tax=Actinophytocola oryzae TaxID=502181 RepID=A0A4R7V7E5_9PSEU|nr:TAXI family TRAP transporter solute-binding subunit [Actinophytocola oryzae]TDV44767.1 hypothetical protein CLV71_11325 [Actinophytocola oryzae]